MSLINFASLGGVSETGKNLYMLEVDKDIFILDCGMKYPSQDMYGIDLVLPDFSYIINNALRVKGIFLSHAHDDHIGALVYLLKYVNLPVYATHFTMEVIKTLFVEHELNPDLYNLNEIKYGQEIKFDKAKVTFIQSLHSIPGSAFINIKTRDGNILYTGNYNFGSSDNNLYKTDYDSLLKLKEEGIFLLLQESISTLNPINRSLNKNFLYKIEKEIKNAKGRTIVSLFSTNLARIEEILKICVKSNKRISLIGRKTQRIVSIALKENLLDINPDYIVNLKYMTDTIKNNDKDLVCLVCGERHEPYFMLQRMCRGVDRLITIDSDDTILALAKPHIGLEKMSAKTLDMLYRKTDNVVTFSNELLLSASSSSEEAKQLMDMLKPKYILPIIGDYRRQVNVKKLAKEIGYKEEDVIIPDAGLIYRFYDKNYLGVTDKIELNDILIEGKGLQDISDQVLKDRLLLASSGVIMFIVNVSAKERKILSKPVIISKGFYTDKNDEKNMIEIFDKVTEIIFKEKFVVWSTYKSELKTELTKYFVEKTKSDPLVIPVIISTEK